MSIRARNPKPEPQTTASAGSEPAINRIAVGVDGYPEGRDAVALGALIGRVTGAELTLVRVHLDSPAPFLTGTDPEREALAELTQLRDTMAPGARIVTETDLSVASALHRVLRRRRCNMIVIGSSARASDGAVRIANLTRQLLSRVDCAVGIAARGMHRLTVPRLQKIGIGYDGSLESAAALLLAGSLAAAADAELHVRAVVDDRVRTLVRSALGGLVATEGTDVIVQEESRLRFLVPSATATMDAKLNSRVVRGDPAKVLLALSQDVDLLLVGSRRWGPLARIVLGSTGESVVHDASCPVVVVPRP